MIEPSRRSLGTTWRTVFDGTAKPTPTLPPAPDVAICELTPITWPAPLSSGPPELPGLIGASVWITRSIEKPFGAWISRPVLETMPAVAVRSSPKGLPMATASSPTCTWLESANASGRRVPASDGSMATTARSEDGSVPVTVPSMRLPRSPNCTSTRLAEPTTWELVTIVPSRSTTKPVPVAVPPDWAARTETTLPLAPL